MVLILLVQVDKVSTPSPNTYNQVTELVRTLLCCQHCLSVNTIKLHLHATNIHVCFNQRGNLMNTLLISEHSVMQFKCKRSSICNSFKMRFRKTLYQRYRTFDSSENRGRKITRIRLPDSSPIWRCTGFSSMPEIVHG